MNPRLLPSPRILPSLNAAQPAKAKFSNSWMTPMAGYSEIPLIWHTASPSKSLEQPIQGEDRRRTTIRVLPEDVLLEIFDFYRLDAMEKSEGRPWKWHRLAHVCRKWRDAISRSPRRLGLRILCESGAPIIKILAFWPTLPLVAKFHVGRKSKNIPRNVMVALRRPDRLCEIDLHVASSMLTLIAEVTQKPCRELESIRITVEAHTGPSILVGNAFLGGSTPHLERIKLDGIAIPFPAIRQVLSSTKNLLELYLGHIPNDAYFSPNELVTGLSTSVRLERLTIDFHSLPSSLPPSMTRPPPQRATFPSLMSFDFHGASGYLEEFLVQIESPALCKIAIRLFNDIFFEIPQFSKFIPRLNTLRSPTRVIIKHSDDFVGVHFEEGNPLSENCFLGTSCRQLDWQLSFVAQILSQLSSHLSGVQSLDIRSGDELPTGEEDVDSTEWVELFQLFTHVTQVCVWERLVPGIVPALIAEDMTAEVLPELTSLQLDKYYRFASVAKAVELFVTTRRLSGRTVSLNSGDVAWKRWKQLQERQWQQQERQERRQQERQEQQDEWQRQEQELQRQELQLQWQLQRQEWRWQLQQQRQELLHQWQQ